MYRRDRPVIESSTRVIVLSSAEISQLPQVAASSGALTPVGSENQVAAILNVISNPSA
jgi:hypothetical protein